MKTILTIVLIVCCQLITAQVKDAQRHYSFSVGYVSASKITSSTSGIQFSLTAHNCYISISSNGVTGDGDYKESEKVPNKAELLDKKVWYMFYLGYDNKVTDWFYFRPKVGYYFDQNIYQHTATYYKKTDKRSLIFGADMVAKIGRVNMSVGYGMTDNLILSVGCNF